MINNYSIRTSLFRVSKLSITSISALIFLVYPLHEASANENYTHTFLSKCVKSMHKTETKSKMWN